MVAVRPGSSTVTALTKCTRSSPAGGAASTSTKSMPLRVVDSLSARKRSLAGALI